MRHTKNKPCSNDRLHVFHKRLRLLQFVEIKIKAAVHNLQGERVFVAVILDQLLLKPKQRPFVIRLQLQPRTTTTYTLTDLDDCLPRKIRHVSLTVRAKALRLGKSDALLPLHFNFFD